MSIMDKFQLKGNVALVTGGARGLGKAMATAFAGDNHTALWYNHFTFEKDAVCMRSIYTRKRGNTWS